MIGMINLFPRQKKRMIIVLAVYLGLAALLLVIGSGNAIVTAVLAVLGLIIVLAAELTGAANAHSQLLNRLYNQMDVEGFLREYEPKLSLKLKDPNMALMVRLHLSNAYCALGRFDDAMAVLSSFEIREGRNREETVLAHFAVTSNLCFCAEQKNDVETAKKYLDELLDLRRQLEKLQENKPQKDKIAFSTELNEQCYQFLTTGHADVEKLKAITRQNQSQQLQRVTSSLWVARADLAENNRREAQSILEQIVKLTPNLYPGKVAADMLAALPAKEKEDN